MADKNFKVKSGLQVPSLTTAGPVVTDNAGNVTSSSTLPISQGGTGQTTADNALNALLPIQGGGNINKYLQTNGTNTQWNTVLQPVYAADAPSEPLVGQVWIESDSSSDSFDPNIIRRKTITATAGQTTFTTDLEFIQGYEQVYFNGMLLLRTSDYTTPSNTSVVLTAAAAAGDIVEILSITNLNSINAATTTTNTFTGAQTINLSSPAVPLTLRAASSGSSNLLNILNGSGTAIGAVSSSGELALGSNNFLGGSNRLTVSGNTMINAGTDITPDINGAGHLRIGGNGYTGFATLDATGMWLGHNSSSRSLIFATDETERMRIDGSGNVGIGITNPSYKLHVAGGVGISAGSGRILFNSNNQTLPTSDDGGIVNLPFGFGGNLTGGQAEMNIFNNVNLSGTSDGGKGFLFVQKTGASTYEMPLRITGNGYLFQTDILGARETGLIRNYTSVHVSSNRGSSFLFGMNDGSFAGIGIYNVASTVSGNSQYIAFNTHEGNQTAGERMRIRQNGAIIMGGAANTQHLNEVLSVNHGANVQALVLRSSDASYTTVQGVYRIVRANNSAYRFAQWDSSDGGDTEFYLRGDGQAYADGSWNGGGADYAEYFEWADGNIENEDRVGYSVALVDNKIKIAEEGDTIIGVISGSPSVVGDHASNKWDKKYLKDDFSRYLRDENGDRILNPEYDSELEYVSRESRPEWAIVGLMGKLRLRKGQVTAAGWIKMRDISETVEEWLVK